MRGGNGFRRAAGLIAAALAGTLSFFVIIGVFGQPFAIAGLLLFVLVAIVINGVFPTTDGES